MEIARDKMFYEHDLVVVVNNCILNLTTNRFIISSPLGEKKLFAIIRHHRYVPTISLRRKHADGRGVHFYSSSPLRFCFNCLVVYPSCKRDISIDQRGTKSKSNLLSLQSLKLW